MLPHDDYIIDIININPPISPSQEWEEGRLLKYEDVEERLTEAVRCAWRQPDRERGWLNVRAKWPDVWRHHHFGDYGDDDPDRQLRSAPLTRQEVADMAEAFDWLDAVGDAVSAEDRRLIARVLSIRARGARVSWRKLKMDMGVPFGEHGLRKRYARAMAKLCNVANTKMAEKAVRQPCQGGEVCKS